MGPIGLPLPSTEAWIVDLATGREALAGQIGELAGRGPQVMLGYRGSATLIGLSGRLDGCTGDVARMDKDGCFHRADIKA